MITFKKNTSLILAIAAIVISIPVYPINNASADSMTVVEPVHSYINSNASVKQRESQTPQKPKINIRKVNPTTVTQFDLTKPSGLTAKDANEILKGTGLEGLGAAYVEAEHKYKVNALYLIAHSALESGWGTSPLAKDKNNLFGVSAFDWNPYNAATTFPSKADCILSTAKLVSEKYLDSKGPYHQGNNLKSMSYHYATDKKWAKKIGEIMVECQTKVISYEKSQIQLIDRETSQNIQLSE